jgi:CRP-like cAMP-binding protein
MGTASDGSDNSDLGSDRPRRGAAGRARGPSAKRRQDGNGTGNGAPAALATSAANHAPPIGAAIWTGGNRILATLPPDEMDVLRPALFSIALTSGQILYEQHSRIETVYFPDTAVASLLSRMGNDAVVEVGTIGNEGMVGLSLFLGTDMSLPEIISQIPGVAQSMSADDFRSAVERLPKLRALVAGCTHAFMAQVSQTAACNRLHGIEQRCARWLLLTHDRVGGADSFPLTHQFLSFMLGVRRAGVTEALGALTLAGLVKSRNGLIQILDRPGLEAACCECYAIVRQHAGEPFNGVADHR